MNKQLIILANHLDKKGFYKEANYIDNLLKKIASQELFLLEGTSIDGDIDKIGVFSLIEKAREAAKEAEDSGAYKDMMLYKVSLDEYHGIEETFLTRSDLDQSYNWKDDGTPQGAVDEFNKTHKTIDLDDDPIEFPFID